MQSATIPPPCFKSPVRTRVTQSLALLLPEGPPDTFTLSGEAQETTAVINRVLAAVVVTDPFGALFLFGSKKLDEVASKGLAGSSPEYSAIPIPIPSLSPLKVTVTALPGPLATMFFA